MIALNRVPFAEDGWFWQDLGPNVKLKYSGAGALKLSKNYYY